MLPRPMDFYSLVHGTLIGSVANLIVAERAKQAGVAIAFRAYGRIGLPLTLASLWFGTWWFS